MAGHARIVEIVELFDAAENIPAFLVIGIQPHIPDIRIQPDELHVRRQAVFFRPGGDSADIPPARENPGW